MLFFKKLRGYTYLLNTNSGEIHDLSRTKHSNCKGMVKSIKRKNRKYLKAEDAFNMLADSLRYDGCRWCLPGFNKERNAKAKKHSKK